jgi:hypothetical protein
MKVQDAACPTLPEVCSCFCFGYQPQFQFIAKGEHIPMSLSV